MNYIAYLRRSTSIQDTTFESQLEAINEVIRQSNGTLLEIVEETESGKNTARPGLEKAVQRCKSTGATLIVKDMSRLGRNLKQICELFSAVNHIRISNLPTETPLILLQILGCFAEFEGQQISARTKAGMAVVKARGTKLGNPRWESALEKAHQVVRQNRDDFLKEIRPMIRNLRNEGHTWKAICQKLNGLGIKTRTGKSWTIQRTYQAAV